jgi:hypothetical protein
MRLCDDGQPVVTRRARAAHILRNDCYAFDAAAGRRPRYTITFFNDHEKFVWERPEELCDIRSGVICTPNNFAYNEPLDDGTMITALANLTAGGRLMRIYRLENSAGTIGLRPRQ